MFQGLLLFKGLCLLFLPNVPGAMFIQGGTFIPDSRVTDLTFQEPSGTMCTIDYWHGNFKNYKLYVVMLMAVTGTLIISM